jgi:radical SAM superfamily enzyme YgiQ (UPF0313 family)
MKIINISKQSVEVRKTQKTKRVLLVVLPYIIKNNNHDTKKKAVRSFLAFPYGVLTIASYIEKNCINKPEIEILDLNIESELNPVQLLSLKLKDFNPNIIGFSMSYDISFKWLQELSTLVKKYDNKSICVAGGPAVTTAYEEIIERAKDIDALCYSEGELGLKNLIEAEDEIIALNEPPWVNSRLLKQKLQPKALYEDLDKVVDINYQLIDVNAYSMKEAFSPFVKYKEEAKQFFIVTSRGCPFKCVFCAEPSFHGANMRYVSVEKVVNHVKKLVNEYGLNVLTIYDDQILMNKERAKELFSKLANLKIRIEMPNGVTMSYIDDEMAYLMKNAGVDTIFLAIESGVKRVLHEIIKKPLAYDRVKPTIELLHNNNIFVCAFFVLGLPGETNEERKENANFIKDVGIDWAFFNYATPLRGSELYQQTKVNNWVDKKYLNLGEVDMTDYILRIPGMDHEMIKRDAFEMNLDVNFVNNRRMRIGDYKTAIDSFEEVISRHPNQPFAHYFLAKALEKSNIDEKNRIDFHLSLFNTIIKNDHDWRKIAERFNLAIKDTILI